MPPKRKNRSRSGTAEGAESSGGCAVPVPSSPCTKNKVDMASTPPQLSSKKEKNQRKKENKKEKRKKDSKLPFDVDMENFIITMFDKKTEEPVEIKLMEYFEESAEELYKDIGDKTWRVPSVFINSGPKESNELVTIQIPHQNDESKLRSDRAESFMADCMYHLSESVYLRSVVGPFFIITSYEYQHYLARLKTYFDENPEKERALSDTGLANMPEGKRSSTPECAVSAAASGCCTPQDSKTKTPVEGKQRGEIDMMVFCRNHAIFLEVKAIGDNLDKHKGDPEVAIFEKLQQLAKQLRDDLRVFNHIMHSVLQAGESERPSSRGGLNPGDSLRISLVAALPNLCKRQVDACFSKNPQLLEQFQDIKILTQDYMPHDVIDVTQGFDKFSKWWKRNVFSYANGCDGSVLEQGMENLTVRDLGGASSGGSEEGNRVERTELERSSVKLLKSMVGRYVGLLSVVTVSKNSKFSLQRVEARSEGQMVWYVGKRFSDIVLTQKQQEYIDRPCQFGYLQGPPGSGKTVVLALRARTWILKQNYAVIINMYRGCRRGRVIGRQMYHTVTQDVNPQTKKYLEGRCIVDSVDVDSFTDKDFQALTRKIYSAFGKGEVGENGSKLLFIVDETYVQNYWDSVYTRLRKNFKDASMWCAGLFGKNPQDFVLFELDKVIRCPPAIQRVLHKIDWDPERLKGYRFNSTDDSLPSNGTHVLTVRHNTEHGAYSDRHPSQCPECGKELATILDQLKVEKPGSPHEASHLKQWTLKCTDITFLAGMPRAVFKPYSKTVKFLDTTISEYRKYMKTYNDCPMVREIERQGYPVRVHSDLSCPGLLEDRLSSSDSPDQAGDQVNAQRSTTPFSCSTQTQNDGVQGSEVINLTWVYTYQGMENKVIIFLPGDHAKPQGDNVGLEWTDPSLNIPCPGLRNDEGEESLPEAGASAGDGGRGNCGSEFCRVVGGGSTADNPQSGDDEEEEDGGAVSPDTLQESNLDVFKPRIQVSKQHFKVNDLDVFGRWDKNNLLIAASRGTSLLIIVQSGTAPATR